ncbi:alpha-latrocrustotoxin-Lt1a-like [Trichogramma pretiosum]|uniref:alpha-latrocrustotoxin-Lt1a-like n=1 Tax=Trichogramma pretiosum TaxID=7493 RepID=UPI0006C95D3D|nr:alpha-latrocrustotoxin-Lt1a-like [Trichogramma pretiosum]
MSSSSGKSDEQRAEHPKLDELKRLRKIYFLKAKSHRYLFLDELKTLIRDWTERLPNLRDIFTRQEIDWLLEVSIDRFDRRREIVDFFIRCGYKDEPDLDENGKPLLRRTTPVHQVDKCNDEFTSRTAALQRLFKIYDKFDVNYIDESGYTHFHMACKYGLADVAEKFLELGQDPNCLVSKTGDSTLHLALASRHKEVAVLLLKHGADPNLANEKGETPLHIICERSCVDGLAKLFFEILDERQQRIQIDAQDKSGNTPLHLATWYRNAKVVELLLRRGSDPNSVNHEGETPLHIIAQKDGLCEIVGLFFQINDELNQLVQVNARDKSGNTPLHLVPKIQKELVDLMLRRGADLTLVNEKGETPLHMIAKHARGVDLFFNVIKDMKQTVQIDTRDNSGRTALEWAVASCCPLGVESLLEHGADVSGFVFPTATDFDQYGKIYQFFFPVGSYCSVIKLAVATGLLAIVELLETNVGQELDLDDTLKVMGFFNKYELYESANFSTTKDVDDLVDSILKEIPKKSTYMDYFKFASSYTLKLHYKSKDACDLRLCEKVTRKFFREWALDCFMALIHYRLPILCCDMIIDQLTNKDLYNICLAAKSQTDEQDKTNVIVNLIKRNNERPVGGEKAPKGLKIEC